ncbi:hypothetical protein E7811_17510 [Aliigemmobacter aestuarii]|uniref:Type I restriction modification DNA specificity domain-containing protein n=1 Tax=Aliigemmobacter aestuarii TaxID=1445661 RepID=A0A4S3MIP1_9RHOB|nr:restriction endonuclease subunit S [Gemmobacter aestuarii]THD81075.1 hypothetical protein E7811_17510 [Gemmobacter aestuarii]
MNAQRLLAAFSKIGDDPDRIQQLRKIAVALAISGKLDNGAASMTPSEVLNAVNRVKAALAKRGAIPKPKRMEEVTAEQLPADFTDPARFAPLGELARIEKGLTGIQQAQPGEYPLVVTSAERSTCDHFDFEGAAAIIPLVSSTGHGNASINRLHYQEGKFALGTILVAVFPYDPALMSARFLFEYLSAFKEELLVSRMTGTANVTLSVGRVAEVPVPLICPEVQRKVDELMALCDQLEAARAGREAVRDRLTAATLTRLTAPETDARDFATHARFALQTLPTLTTRPDQIKTLRQTILNLAVRGKLVGQDSAAEAVVQKYRSEDQHPLLPDNWYTLNFGKFCDIEGGNQPPKSQFVDTPREGYVRLFQIRDLGERPVPVYIPVSTARSLCKKGEILIGRYGASVGKIFWAEDGAYNVAMAKFIWPADAFIAPFAYLLLKSEFFQGPLLGASRSAQAGFNKGDLSAINFPLPPLAEQHRIVAKVDALMTLCDQLEASLTTATTTRSRLLEALLHEALGGAPGDQAEAAA